MKTFKSMLKAVLVLAVPAALSVATPRAALAQAVVVIEPPADYIATVDPEYYENRPVYFYNEHWYYRDHGRWSYYHDEPGYLRDRRGPWHERYERYQREHAVRHYEHAHAVVHDAHYQEHHAPSNYRYRR